jgi:predicted MFS family arabinose efflux permease
VFYLNLPFGILAVVVFALAYPRHARISRVRVDWTGAALLFGGIMALLVALSDAIASPWPWLAATVVLLAAFVYVEQRVGEPILPLDLFATPIISRSSAIVFMLGIAMFGAIAFVPLFVQVIMGGTATEAGQALTPLFLGWVLTSVLGARLTVRAGYRPVAVAGGALMTVGFAGLAMLDTETRRAVLLMDVLLLGCGMGLSMLSLLLAVQHGVPRSRLGVATSLNQFSRSIGAAVGVAAMGALLGRELLGIDLPGGVHGIAAGGMQLQGAARVQFATALRHVFAFGALVSGVALAGSFVLPPVDLSRGVPTGAGETLLAAEMANLESEGEPQAVEGS